MVVPNGALLSNTLIMLFVKWSIINVDYGAQSVSVMCRNFTSRNVGICSPKELQTV